MLIPVANSAPSWALAMRRFTQWLAWDFGGGPRLLKMSWVINFQKVGTFPLLASSSGTTACIRWRPGSIWPCMAATA